MKAALIDSNNVVQNVIVWDETCTAPEGLMAIVLEDNHPVSRGWLWNGNTNFEDPNPPSLYVPTEQDYANAIQTHIDATAQSKQYADGVSLASYASSTITQWKNEADVFIAWRDSVWSFAFGLMEQVKQGTVPQPSIEELIAQLPAITWPT